jgi:hypothetical protein
MFEKDEVFIIPENEVQKKYLAGAGHKGLLIVVDEKNFDVQEEETLRKLVGAIGFDYARDIYLWKWSRELECSIGLMDKEYKDLLMFGVTPEQVGLFVDYKAYTVHVFEQCRVLVSDGIRDINSQPARKQVLWSMLKKMFLP